MNQEKDPQTAAAEEDKSRSGRNEAGRNRSRSGRNRPGGRRKIGRGRKLRREAKAPQTKRRRKKKARRFSRVKSSSTAAPQQPLRRFSSSVIVLVNVFVGILSDKYPSINFDVTKTGNNSLSTEALQIVDKVKTEVDITICATKEACEQTACQRAAAPAAASTTRR